MASETERIGHRHVNIAFLGLVRGIVQVAFRIRAFKIGRRRDYRILHGQCRDDDFNGTGSSQHVPGHGFGRTYTCLVSHIAQSFLDRICLGHIIKRCSRTVRIDIKGIPVRIVSRFGKCFLHCGGRNFP